MIKYLFPFRYGVGCRINYREDCAVSLVLIKVCAETSKCQLIADKPNQLCATTNKEVIPATFL